MNLDQFKKELPENNSLKLPAFVVSSNKKMYSFIKTNTDESLKCINNDKLLFLTSSKIKIIEKIKRLIFDIKFNFIFDTFAEGLNVFTEDEILYMQHFSINKMKPYTKNGLISAVRNKLKKQKNVIVIHPALRCHCYKFIQENV